MSWDYSGSDLEYEDERKIASIIRLSQEYDKFEAKGCSKEEIFESLRPFESSFLPGSFDALANTRELAGGFMEASKVHPSELKQGMRLLEEVRLSDGQILASSGAIVSFSLVQIIQSHLAALGESVFPELIEVLT